MAAAVISQGKQNIHAVFFIITRFSKFVHWEIAMKILYSSVKKFSPHLKCVNSLLCEIWMLKITTELPNCTYFL